MRLDAHRGAEALPRRGGHPVATMRALVTATALCIIVAPAPTSARRITCRDGVLAQGPRGIVCDFDRTVEGTCTFASRCPLCCGCLLPCGLDYLAPVAAGDRLVRPRCRFRPGRGPRLVLRCLA